MDVETLQRVRSGLYLPSRGAVPQYRLLREGGVRATLVGNDGGEGYVEADVFVRRDVEQITVGSKEHPRENIVERYLL